MIINKTTNTQNGTQTQKVYSSKLLTGEQAKELVRQCKEYVQAKKLEQQNNG